MESKSSEEGVYVSHVRPFQTLINRAQILLHSIALLLLIFYRLSFFFLNPQSKSFFPWLSVFASELLLAFIWLLGRAFRWRPQISKDIILPPEKQKPPQLLLPPLDVFIFTADPEKEPTLDVMNILISAVALDYPPNNLHLYLSDDSGSPVTLHGIREARRFARWWVPFCRKYGIKQPCPEAYFSPAGEYHRRCDISTDEFLEQKLIVKEKYEEFKDQTRDGTKRWVGETTVSSRVDHPALVQIIKCNDRDGEEESRNQIELPVLVYVSREKKPSHPHHFRAGALNVLVEWPGMNGLQGPILLGTCFYINRLSLYGISPQGDKNPSKYRENFGDSDEFMRPINGNNRSKNFAVEEAQNLASCTYENGNQWGRKVGFLYDSVLEDFLTSLIIHSQGWRSVFSNPERAQFLGNGTTSLNELLVQVTRWNLGLLEMAISRFCPLFYCCQRSMISLLQTMCYAQFAFYPLCSFSLWTLATIPQLCLLHGIPVFPKVSSPFFPVYCFIFISALSFHLHEVLISGGSVKNWLNEQRMWMIKGITACFYGSLDALMGKIGVRNASFVPTNKVIDDDQIKRYNMDMYDFQASSLFLSPMAGLVFLNLVVFSIGFGRIVVSLEDWEETFGQLFLCFYILLMSFPIIEAMVMRNDKACFPFKHTLGSALVVLLLLYFQSILFM
ncbi:cellulose synthase-like protein E6 [Benincasa hispida]|uniref:cellulose synthase-like protein E6 n=1 Tax=Benincasa hispida TaxID=102211 RepID=UPI0018FF66FF|nr:cellulose synthase-like protein E6 [Benincasa hispida]